MIGTKYTSELLAALTKTPLMARLDVAVPPVGDDPEEIDSYTVRYSDNGVKETTLFAAGDVRLVSIRVVGATNWSRVIDAVVEKYVDRVSVLSESSGVCVGFTTYRTFDKSDIETDTFPFSAGTVVDVDMGNVSGYGFVGYVEETYSAIDKITSFYEGTDDADPWLVIVEPN